MSDGKSIRDFENMVEYESSIEDARERAEQHIMNVWREEVQLELDSIGVKLAHSRKVDLVSYKEERFHL